MSKRANRLKVHELTELLEPKCFLSATVGEAPVEEASSDATGDEAVVSEEDSATAALGEETVDAKAEPVGESDSAEPVETTEGVETETPPPEPAESPVTVESKSEKVTNTKDELEGWEQAEAEAVDTKAEPAVSETEHDEATATALESDLGQSAQYASVQETQDQAGEDAVDLNSASGVLHAKASESPEAEEQARDIAPEAEEVQERIEDNQTEMAVATERAEGSAALEISDEEEAEQAAVTYTSSEATVVSTETVESNDSDLEEASALVAGEEVVADVQSEIRSAESDEELKEEQAGLTKAEEETIDGAIDSTLPENSVALTAAGEDNSRPTSGEDLPEQRVKDAVGLVDQEVQHAAEDEERQLELTRALFGESAPAEDSAEFQAAYSAVGNALQSSGPSFVIAEEQDFGAEPTVAESNEALASKTSASQIEAVEVVESQVEATPGNVTESSSAVETKAVEGSEPEGQPSVEGSTQESQEYREFDREVVPSVDVGSVAVVVESEAKTAITSETDGSHSPTAFSDLETENRWKATEHEVHELAELAESSTPGEPSPSALIAEDSDAIAWSDGSSRIESQDDAKVELITSQDVMDETFELVEAEEAGDTEEAGATTEGMDSSEALYVLPTNVKAGYDANSQTALLNTNFIETASDSELLSAVREETGEHLAAWVVAETGLVFEGDVGERVGAVLSGSTAAEAIEAEKPGTLQTQAIVAGERTTVQAMTGSALRFSASGDEGGEVLQLVVGGEVVDTFTVDTQFRDYTYQAADSVLADDVRVEFTNDLYQPEIGLDFNLNVDFLDLDGRIFQTEDPSVFSTGTWLDPEGIVPGFGRGESLHSNGYFQYSESDPTGNELIVRASGDEGTEQFELQLAGQAVASFDVTTEFSDYLYRPEQAVTADDVRVVFVNDLFAPENNFDANLNVDYIQIDGTRYETGTPLVYSTGAWVEPQGIVPGFDRGETLHSNGYFQYADDFQESGVFSLASSVFQVSETSSSVEIQVNRANGTIGPATIDYQTLSGTAVDGEDFTAQNGTLVFQAGETSRLVSVPILNDVETEGTEQFSFAIDNPAGAGLLAPRTATITIQDDEQLPVFPNYGDFGNIVGLNLNGSSVQTGDQLQVASSTPGSVFYANPVAITETTSFQTSFESELPAAVPSQLDFLIHSDSEGTEALSAPIGNSLLVRLNNDSSGVGQYNVVLNDGSNPLATGIANGVDFSSATRTFVDYNGQTNQLAVYASEENAKPAQPIFVADVDLASVVGPQAYVGFRSQGGGSVRVNDWSYDDSVPPPISPPPGDTLVEEAVVTGLIQPTSLDFTADGRNLYVAEQRGVIQVQRDGVDAGVALDLTDRVNGTRDRGLLDIAIHPDVENNPYLYTLYTYDPPEVYQNASDPLAGPDRNGNRAGRLTRWTLDAATEYTRVVENSEVVLVGKNSTWENFNGFANSTNNFNEAPAGILADGSNLQDFIATDSESHTIGSVEFAPDGALIVSIGDGTSYNRVDPRTTRVQDIDNLSGKILRIDPISGDGLTSNPFFNGDATANRSKVYQLGLRNPFRTTVDAATGQIYIGDVGWTRWEEINTGEAGANFGWPFYEGGDNGNLQTGGYQSLPEAANFYATEGSNVIAPSTALSHSRDGINAIVLGDVYRGNQFPAEYQGDLFFNDLGRGIVRHAELDQDGNVVSYDTFTTGAQIVVQIVQGPDGNMYFVDLDDGTVGRWKFV